MDKIWSARDWSPTLADHIEDHIELYSQSYPGLQVPQNLEKYIENLSQTTITLQQDPYNANLWLERAKTLLQLRYPELAIGDAVKSQALTKAARDAESPLGQSTRLGVAKLICSQGSGGLLSSEFLRTRDGAASVDIEIRRLEFEALLMISRALFVASSFSESLITIRECARFDPDSISLRELLKAVRAAAADEEKVHPAQSDQTSSPEEREEHKSHGEIQIRHYPWMGAAYFRRAPDALESIKNNMVLASRDSCTVKHSPIRDNIPMLDSAGRSIDIFGIYATRDLQKGQQVLRDRTTLCAVEDQAGRCSSCCRVMPSEPTTTDCCGAAFCSGSCLDHARTFFHSAVCGKDLASWESTAGSLKFSAYNITDDRLLLRLLACAVRFWKPEAGEGSNTITGLHPLEAPLINRMTAMYEGSVLRRFSMTRDILRPMSMLKQLGIDVYANHDFDTWVLQTLMIRMNNNCRQYNSAGLFGIAINPLYTFFNHSCKPNVSHAVFDGRSNSTLRMVTTRNVKAGQELFITYLEEEDLDKPVEERQELLMQWTGCECQCFTCKKEREGLQIDVDDPEDGDFEFFNATKGKKRCRSRSESKNGEDGLGSGAKRRKGVQKRK